jgi:cytidylate kinase
MTDMPIITISSNSPEREEEIAREVSQKLGFPLLGREILAEVARDNQVPLEELTKALDDPPGLLGMRPKRRRELLSHIQTACLERVQDDNLVCHGLAAHLYLVGVSHALKVQILADPKERAAELAERKGVGPDKAAKLLKQQDEARRRWSQEIFSLDETDSELYDMVFNLTNLEPAKAVEIICDAAGYSKFQAMTYSRKYLADKLMGSRVLQKLMHRFPDIKVQVSDGTVVARLQSLKKDQRKKQEAVRELAGQVPGVNYVEVHVIRDFFGQAAQSGR